MKLRFIPLVILIFIFLSSCGRLEPTFSPEHLNLSTPSPFQTASITTAPTKTPQFIASFIPTKSDAYRTTSSPLGDWTANVYVPTDQDNPKFTTRITHITGKPEWALDYQTSQFEEESYYFPFYWTNDGQYLYLVVFHAMDGCGMALEFYNGSGLFKLDLQSGELSEIISEDLSASYAFSLSPQETTLVYAETNAKQITINLKDLLSGQEKSILLDKKYDGVGNFAWFPNEDKVLLLVKENACQDKENYSILILNLSTLKVVTVIATLDQDLSVTEWISPDILHMRDWQENIWILDLKSAQLVLATPSP